MATGISKTKWGGDVSPEAVSSGAAILSYPNKLAEEIVLATKPQHYLTANNADMLDADGQLFFDDNLSALATLCCDQAICGRVRLIYIDPPYATGSVFKSRAQEDAYSDTRKGTHYLEFMRHRLILLHQLLADDGSIYVHIDQTMLFHVKLLLDEIFGASNFRNLITRKKSNPKNYTRKTYGNISDFILFYTKTNNYVWNRAYDEWTGSEIKREYPCIEKATGRRYKKVPVHAPGTRNGATGQVWRGMMPPKGKHWQYTPTRLDEMDARGEIYWSPTGNPRRKVYLDNSKGKPVQDIWLDDKDAHNQNIKITGYPTEKNPSILKRIIEASSNDGDLVLDCFAGSGTTLAVASQLGRKWIGVDASELAIRTIVKRFRYGTHAMGDFVNQKQNSVVIRHANNLTFQIHCLPPSLSLVAEILSTEWVIDDEDEIEIQVDDVAQKQEQGAVQLGLTL